MLSISISIGEVSAFIETDQELSFDAIDTLLKRATDSALDAYNRYAISEDMIESMQEENE